MNGNYTNNDVDKYLSIKVIVILSLTITMAYYFLYTLNHYFGRPSFANKETEQLTEKPEGKSNIIRFLDARARAQERREAPPMPPEEDKMDFYQKVALNIPFTFIMVFAVLLYCRVIFARNFKRRSDELAVIVLGTMVITFLLSALFTIIQLIIFPNWPDPNRRVFSYVMRGYLGDCSLMAIALMVAYLVRSQYREKMADVENETLRAENLTSRYETLKTQMDPHFLFNSLNTLKTLIDVDSTKAEDFVHQLSSVLRYTLKNEEVVTLEKELDCVRSYCKMMKIRYGDNLLFDHHINHEKYDNYLVLPLSIQGLIENAIKHNVVSSRQPLTIHIMTDDNNHLIISNEIHPKIGKEEGSGIGLANLAERYRIKWNENVEIFDDGKNFTVTLPLKQNE